MLLLVVIPVFSQEGNPVAISSGKIVFEEKIKLEIKLEGDAAQFAGMLPKERKSEKILSFTDKATLFEENTSVEEEMNMEQAEGVQVRMMVSGENKIYTDLENSRIIEQREFMNRIFCVERGLPDTKWKVPGNQKEILGYQCMEAVSIDTAGISTSAWFTPSLTVKGGPGLFSNLPGMVLEVNVNNGMRTFIARSIQPVQADELKMDKPKEGKKVTEEEYNTIVSEKMKEMGIEGGQPAQGGASVRIIVR